jgi:hypothetical protein
MVSQGEKNRENSQSARSYGISREFSHSLGQFWGGAQWVLRDGVINMQPSPCGAVVIAAHLGLRVSRVIANGFLATGRPIWGGISAADLDAAFRPTTTIVTNLSCCRPSTVQTDCTTHRPACASSILSHRPSAATRSRQTAIQ